MNHLKASPLKINYFPVITLFFSLFLASCGGGTGSDPDTGVDTTPPIITNLVTTVSTTTATFDFHSDEEGTVYYIVQQGGNVPTVEQVKNGTGNGGILATLGNMSVSIGSNSGTLSDLSAGTTYMLYVIGEDDEGNQTDVGSQEFITEDLTYTEDGDWKTVMNVRTPNGSDATTENRQRPRIGFDSDGNLMAAWEEFDWNTSTFSIYATRYMAASDQWETPKALMSNSTRLEDLELAINANGQAVVIWRYNSNTIFWQYFDPDLVGTTNISSRSRLVATESSVSDGWNSGVNNLFYSSSLGSQIRVAIDSTGDAMAVWYYDDGVGDDAVYMRKLDRSASTNGTWSTAEKVNSSTGLDAYDPQVAVDGNGRYTVIWSESDSEYNILARLYPSDYPTSPATAAIEISSDGDAEYASLAVNSSGDAAVVWEHYWDNNGSWVDDNQAAIFSKDNDSWASPVTIGTGDSDYSQITLDASGNSIAVWQSQTDDGDVAMANRYSATSASWLTEAIKISNADYNAVQMERSPSLAMDTNGNAMVLWEEYDGSMANIYANRYQATSDKWSGPQRIDDSDLDTEEPAIAVDANGNGMALWHREYANSRHDLQGRYYQLK